MSLQRQACGSIVVVLAWVAIAPHGVATQDQAAAPRGIVVEEVATGFAGEKAGIRPGDLLLSWVRAAAAPANPVEARGDIGSPFDFADTELEQAPRGVLQLIGMRGGERYSLVVPPGRWAITVRPQFPPLTVGKYQRAKALIADGDTDEGVAVWREMAAHAENAGDWELAAWLFFRVGETLANARRWDEAQAGYAAAVAAVNGREATLLTTIRHAQGGAYERQNNLPQAEAAYREALRIGEKSSLDTLRTAATLTRLGSVALARSDFPRAEELYQRALAIRERLAPASLAVASSLNSVGIVARNRRDLATAEGFFRRASALGEQLAPDSFEVAVTLNNLALIARSRGELAVAEDLHRRSLALHEKLDPGGIDVAGSLTNLGTVARNRGDLAAAEEFHRRSLAILEKVAPGSLDVAGSLNNLGGVAAMRGDLVAAEDFFRRSLAIKEQLAAESLDVALTINNLGLVLFERGDLSASETFFRRSLAIRETLAPGSVDVAANLNDLGLVAYRRGDLAAAEDLHRRSLAIREGLLPDSLDTAASLNNLGVVARGRGDLAAAQEFFRRALAIHEKTAGNIFGATASILAVAEILNNLGEVARDRGDFATAEEFYQRSLAIHEKVAPETLDFARTVASLGHVARARGDLDAAEDLHRRALGVRERLAPDSLDVATSLDSLGDVARDRGDVVRADNSYRTALTLRQKLAPGSSGEAEMLHKIGLLERGAGRTVAAGEYLQRAIASLEVQTGRLGGAEEVRAGFSARYADYYRDYIDVLLELEQPAQAFEVLERSRARSLLAMLAERDLVFAGDLPADLARERTRLNAEYDDTQAAIAELNPARDQARVDRMLARLRELRDTREALAGTIRKASPRFASLHYPQPLDLGAAQRALDTGTVLLAYSVTKEKTFLFVVQPDRPLVRAARPVAVVTLGVGEAVLREKIAVLRSLIQRGVDSTPASTASLHAAGQELFDTLVSPAGTVIAASDRVLISPDGPLHTLPFAALVQSSDRPAPGAARYFVEWKPLHVVASVTVYAELKKARRPAGDAGPSPVLAAFGDPTYPPAHGDGVDTIANLELRAAVRRGYALNPLPASRIEVERIARLYGDRAATYLGDQATEERAKAVGRGVRYLHFASHGLLDERFPLNSALALTIPSRPAEGQANGLLQAWEIFEQMRIDADLVTLSACETALGKELGGEGLVGLTRAFHYAGARSVLASLWSVGDESTAELMTLFYSHLRGGRTKDDALRAAQIEMIRTRRPSHPFQWAAFQLAGDWK